MKSKLALSFVLLRRRERQVGKKYRWMTEDIIELMHLRKAAKNDKKGKKRKGEVDAWCIYRN